MNLAESSGLTPATLMGTPSALGTTLTLHPVRPGPAASPTPERDHDHDHEESGCVCQNCSGNGACGGGAKRHRAEPAPAN